MSNFISSTINLVKQCFYKANTLTSYIPTYRVIEITQENDDYVAIIQMIGKNIVFRSKPEDILASDEFVDQFSPQDIRALTYYGYLSISKPNYKILSQRLSKNSEKLVFALRKHNDPKIFIKSASEINGNKDILKNLSPIDANIIGYSAASESFNLEKYRKKTADLDNFKERKL